MYVCIAMRCDATIRWTQHIPTSQQLLAGKDGMVNKRKSMCHGHCKVTYGLLLLNEKMVFRLAWCLLVFLFLSVESLNELSTLKPHEVALMQFDSRPPRNYWLSAALWNQAYAHSHGHRFIYYTFDTDQHCTFGKF